MYNFHDRSVVVVVLHCDDNMIIYEYNPIYLQYTVQRLYNDDQSTQHNVDMSYSDND